MNSTGNSFDNIKQLLVSGLESKICIEVETINSLLGYTTIIVDYFLQSNNWVASEKMNQALAVIGKAKLLNNEQQRLFCKCKIIKNIFNCAQNSNTFSLKLDESSISNASSFEIYGLFEGIYDAFRCSAFTKHRLEIAKLFDCAVNQVIKNEELHNLLRKDTKLKLISEDIFIYFCDNFWFLDDPELGIFYLQKGAKLLDSAKLNFHACLLDFKINRHELNYEQIIQNASLSDILDDFLYFLNELSKLAPEIALSICQQHRKSTINPIIRRGLVNLEMKFLISTGNSAKLKTLINEELSEKSSSVNQLLIPIWLAAEKENSERHFKTSFELYKICNELLKSTSNSELAIPTAEIYANMLELSIRVKKYDEISSVMEQNQDTSSEIINLLHFKINSSLGNYEQALLNYGKFSKISGFVIEALFHCTGFSVELSKYAFISDILSATNISLIEKKDVKFLSKLIMHFLCAIPQLPANIWTEFGNFFVQNHSLFVKHMENESKELAFKLIFNLGISNLQSYSFDNAYTLLSICNSIDNICKDTAFFTALFVAGVCLLKTKLSEKLVAELNNLILIIGPSGDELFQNYHTEFLIATNQCERLQEYGNIQSFSLEQLAKFLSISSNHQTISLFLDYILAKINSECSENELITVEKAMKKKFSEVMYNDSSFIFQIISTDKFQQVISDEMREWTIILIYNYAQFLSEIAKLRQAIQWTELGLALSTSLHANPMLVHQFKSFYVSLLTKE